MLKKTELIIFRRKEAANIDYGIKFKLDGKRLTPVNTVKYLGILLDGIGILSKLRHNANLKILKLSIIQFLYHIFNMVPNCGVNQIKKVKTKYRRFRIEH